jgi:hypothetical protein
LTIKNSDDMPKVSTTNEQTKRKPVLVKKAAPVITAPVAQEIDPPVIEKKVTKPPRATWLAAKEIAKSLNENHLHIPVMRLIEGVIKTLGLEQAQQLVQQAKEIHAGEGMWLAERNRYRTLGGIFFVLAQEKMGKPAWQKMHHPQRNQSMLGIDLDEALKEPIMLTPGALMSAIIKLVGRPGEIKQKRYHVSFTMTSEQLPQLPNGLPKLTAPTKYLVMVTIKQWQKVAKAIAAPTDQLVIEGYCVRHDNFAGIVVMAFHTTTKALQKAQAAAQKSAMADKAAEPTSAV